MEQVALGILEEEHAAAAGRRLDVLGEADAPDFKFCPRGGDGIHPQGYVPPAVQLVVAGLRQREIAGVDFDHDPARQGDEEGGRSLVFAESDAPPQRAQIPIFERYGVSCRQSQMFYGEFHTPLLAGFAPGRTLFSGNAIFVVAGGFAFSFCGRVCFNPRGLETGSRSRGAYARSGVEAGSIEHEHEHGCHEETTERCGDRVRDAGPQPAHSQYPGLRGNPSAYMLRPG